MSLKMEHVPIVFKALGLTPSNTQKKKRKGESLERWLRD